MRNKPVARYHVGGQNTLWPEWDRSIWCRLTRTPERIGSGCTMMGAINRSIFGSHAASRVTRGSGDWPDLFQPPEKPGPHPNKASCPWIKMALFGDHRTDGGSLRNNANVQVGVRAGGRLRRRPDFRDEAISRLESHNIRAGFHQPVAHAGETGAGAFLGNAEQPMPAVEQRRVRWRA